MIPSDDDQILKIAAELLSETELFNDCAVTSDVLLLEVAKKISSVTDHLQKSATAVVILRVVLKMRVERIDAVREDRDLNLRGSGVVVAELVLSNNLLLEFLLNHGISPFKNKYYTIPKNKANGR